MKAEWIVVNFGSQDQNKRIVDNLREMGRVVHTPTLKQALDSDLKWEERGLPDHKNVVVYGSITSTDVLTKDYGYLSWLDLEQTDCTAYYARFGKYLVQDPYVMLPLGELRRRWDWLYERFGEDGHLFVRPSANDKAFTAKCIERRDCVYFDKAGQDPATLIVVSRPVLITREYRLFMHHKKYLSGSLYKVAGQLLKSGDVPEEVVKFSEMVATQCHYQGLPPVWVMDVAEVGDEWKVLEVSGSSCAGFYEADYKKVLQAISEEADKVFTRAALEQ